MADAPATYAVAIGVFVFLTALLFATRAKRPHGSEASAAHSAVPE
jgi:hypothetical protein